VQDWRLRDGVDVGELSRPDSAADQLPARVQAMAELCRPHYQRLYAERLTV
jgi:hypothetical protein